MSQAKVSRELLAKQEAFCVVRLGMSLGDARSLEPWQMKALRDEWEAKELDRMLYAERLVGRLCAIVQNFANSFSKNPRSPVDERNYMTLQKSLDKKREGECVLDARGFVAMMKKAK